MAVAFPRYDADVHAELARDALHGRLGDLADSVHAMAVLFALDRRAAAPTAAAAAAEHDLVVVDRYVASNAAYGAARLHQDACGEFVAWVPDLEIGRFDLPFPTGTCCWTCPVPSRPSAPRTVSDRAGRERDRYESDAGLQDRTGAVYRRARGGGLVGAVDGARRCAGVDARGPRRRPSA